MKVEILEQNGHHFLWMNGELWMWDLPLEHEQQEEIAKKAYGDVLVAGYGFGLVQKYLIRNPFVKSVLTVEIYPEVIRAWQKTFGPVLYGDVIIRDFFEMSGVVKYDCVIGDIWLDVHPNYLADYVAFEHKAISLLKSGGRVLAWGEECFKVWAMEQEQGKCWL